MNVLSATLVIVVASSVSADESSIVKLSANGKALWKARFSKDTGEGVWQYTEDSKGNLYIAGWEGAVAKYTPKGNLAWKSRVPKEWSINDIAVDGRFNVYAVGVSRSGQKAIGVISVFNPSGNMFGKKALTKEERLFDSAAGCRAGGVFVSSIARTDDTLYHFSEGLVEKWALKVPVTYASEDGFGFACDDVCSGGSGWRIGIRGSSLLWRGETTDDAGKTFKVREVSQGKGTLIKVFSQRGSRPDFWNERTRSLFKRIDTGRFLAG